MNKKKSEYSDLFREFDPVSTEEWERVIRSDLDGADYREKLRWRTGEGIDPLPFYRREDLEKLNRSAPLNVKGDWQICQPIYAGDIPEARAEAAGAVENGAESLRFRLKAAAPDGMLGGDLEGTPIVTLEDMEELLEGIPFPATPLHFDCGVTAPVILAMLQAASRRRNADPAGLRGTLLDDPFRYLLEHGHRWTDPVLSNHRTALSHILENGMDGMKTLGVDARLYHEAGATIVQELGLALSAASEYFAGLREQGFAAEDIARQIHFTFPVGSLYFPEMAKFRATRLLWKNLSRAWGAETDTVIHAETSGWNKTLYDPHTNLLRTTTEGMAAAIAGCDLLTIHPFDRDYRPPEDLSQRMSRNSQIIMKEEAYLNRVADPGAGSWYVEELTEQVAEKAWEFFQEIEQQGGLLEAARSGYVHLTIDKAREERDRRIALRRRVFVGTNKFPDPEDEAAGRIESTWRTVSLPAESDALNPDVDLSITAMENALENGASLGDLLGLLKGPREQQYDVLTPWRGAAAFEEIRLETERSGRTPVVLTLPLGNRKMRKVRSSFAAGLLGCAGYRIEDPVGFDSVGEAVGRIGEVRPDIAVLCSSDEEYPDLVNRLQEQLGAAGPAKPILVLAGDPGGRRNEYAEKGIDRFIHARSNVLETLRQFQDLLGITGERQPA